MYRKYKNWITYMAQTGTRSVRGEINIQGRATIPLALPLDKTFSEDINKYSPYRVKKYSGPEWSSVDRGRRLLFWDFISILAWVGQYTCRFSSSAALSNHSFVHPSSFFHLSISRLCGAWMTQNHNKACHRHAGPLCTFYTLPLQSVKCLDGCRSYIKLEYQQWGISSQHTNNHCILTPDCSMKNCQRWACVQFYQFTELGITQCSAIPSMNKICRAFGICNNKRNH